MGGATVQWLRDGLGIIRRSTTSRRWPPACPTRATCTWSRRSPGFGAPQWDAGGARHARRPHARLSTRARGARRAREHRLPDRRPHRRHAAGCRPATCPSCAVDGGAARNDLLLQFQADLLGVPVLRARKHRDHGLRRRRARRPRHRPVEIPGRARLVVAARQALRPRPRRRAAATRAGTGTRASRDWASD